MICFSVPQELIGHQCYQIQKSGEDILIACDTLVCKIPETGSLQCIQQLNSPKMYFDADTNILTFANSELIFQSTVDNFLDTPLVARNVDSNLLLTAKETAGGPILDIVATANEIIYTTSNGLYRFDSINGEQLIDSGDSIYLDIQT